MFPFRKWIILTHRYLGILLSFFFAMWFLSGIAMIYARGMPGLTPEIRLERLPPINLSEVKLSPSQALEKAELGDAPASAVLLMVIGRPAYRFATTGPVTVFADSGEQLPEIRRQEAMRIASLFLKMPESQLHYVRELREADQWTLEGRDLLPMHEVSASDDAHTTVYISEQTAEVEVITTRASRTLAWFAAIPHWMYFTSLRLNDRLWRQVVLWTSGVGAVL